MFVIVVNVEVARVGLEGFELLDAFFPGDFGDECVVAGAGAAAAFGALELKVDVFEFIYSFGVQFGMGSFFIRWCWLLDL